jgi:membrane protease YdiL (CAAX protease family)
MVALGLKFGFGYPLAPYSGMFAMVFLCFFIGSFMNYTMLKTKSIIPATIIHGAFNSICELSGLLALAGLNPLIGPKPIGIIGGIGFVITGVVCLFLIKGKHSSSSTHSGLNPT